MKKTSIIIASLVLFMGFSFASPFQVKQETKAKTEKKTGKKEVKKEVKKVPARKTVTKDAATKGPAKQ